jgi:hypothetical protein
MDRLLFVLGLAVFSSIPACSAASGFTATPTELRMGNASGELLVYTRTGD